MKKSVIYRISVIFGLIAMLWSSTVSAAINARIDFEAGNVYTGQGLVRSVTVEAIVMERSEAEQIVMSVCTPDLGLSEKIDTTRQPSRPIEKQVLLEDDWLPVSPHPAVTATRQGDGTLLRIACTDGQPIEFRLRKR